MINQLITERTNPNDLFSFCGYKGRAAPLAVVHLWPYGRGFLRGRVQWHLSILLFLFALSAPGKDLFLSNGAETECVETGGSNPITMMTFKFGDIEITMPRVSHWVENPTLWRPQLLMWRCGPISSPSTIHLQLLTKNERPQDDGLLVSLLDPLSIAAQYHAPEWVPITNASPVTSMKCMSYQKVDLSTPSSKEHYREEVHILTTNHQMGFGLHMHLSSQLNQEDEAAIRQALIKLSVNILPQAETDAKYPKKS